MPTWDEAVAGAHIYVVLKCGGSGGRCTTVFGHAVKDGDSDDWAIIAHEGRHCRHYVNLFDLDEAAVDALVQKARQRPAGSKPLVYTLPVGVGPQPSVVDALRSRTEKGLAEFVEVSDASTDDALQSEPTTDSV
jgi:hypothetical protein